MGKVPKVKTNVSAAPISTAGYTWGQTTSRNARKGPAPRLRAVSTALASTDSQAAVVMRATSGAL